MFRLSSEKRSFQEEFPLYLRGLIYPSSVVMFYIIGLFLVFYGKIIFLTGERIDRRLSRY